MSEFFAAGGPVMYPLLICSIITVAVIIDRALFWLRLGNGRRPDLVAEFCRKANGSTPTLPEGVERDVVARVLLVGAGSPNHEASWRMQQAAMREANKMTGHLGILNTMVSLAPLLGIFGTVLGIIESFHLLGDASLVDPVAASGGLAQALITTAFGLAIAMPSLVAYKYFQAKVLKLRCEVEANCTELEMALGISVSRPC